MNLKDVVAPALAVIGIACAYYTYFTLNGKIRSLEEQLQKTHVMAASSLRMDDLKHLGDQKDGEEEAPDSTQEEAAGEEEAEEEIVVEEPRRPLPVVLPNANASQEAAPASPASSTGGWSVSEGGAIGVKARRRRLPRKAQDALETADGA